MKLPMPLDWASSYMSNAEPFGFKSSVTMLLGHHYLRRKQLFRFPAILDANVGMSCDGM